MLTLDVDVDNTVGLTLKHTRLNSLTLDVDVRYLIAGQSDVDVDVYIDPTYILCC